MKTRLAVTVGVAFVGIGLALSQVSWVSPAVASPQVGAAAAVLTVPAFDGESQYSYVGSKKCKKCHMKQSKSWKKSKKYSALDVLMPGKATEIKEKHGLDVNKDYSTDENCVKCHTTGYGHEGGYAVPDPSDEKAVKRAKKLAGVGCESCHGPGSGYVKSHDEIMKSKRTYKVEEMYAAGLKKIEESTCLGCHNDKSPTYDPAAPFDFEKMKEKGAHEHFPLKQREE